MKFLRQFILRSPLFSSKNAIEENIFSEALYLASPVLYSEQQKFKANNLKDSKEIEKLRISIYKYQSRSSHRCTPFGLFAGISIGNWGQENSVLLSSNLKERFNRKTRFDMNVLCLLAQELARKNYIKPYLKYFPNNSIYRIGNSFRYIEYYYQETRRIHKISKVDFSDYLEYILNEAKTGLSQQELITLLTEQVVSVEEATVYIEDLIQSQLLINQLEPTLTGKDYFEVLLCELDKILNENSKNTELHLLIENLTQINDLIAKLDVHALNSVEDYQKIHRLIKPILTDLNENNLFQTDLYKEPKNASINLNIQDSISKAIRFLNKISPQTSNKNLEEFKRRFYERYEDSQVPILIALDTETGIGYPNKDNNGINELVEDVFAIKHSTNEIDLKWNLLQSHLLKLIVESKKQNQKILQISETDFEGIDFSANVMLPSSISIMFKVINSTTDKIAISNIGGSSAINLLGRFAGGSEELNSIVKEIADFEQQQFPDKILAEIVHLPESRTGNILSRTSFRKYEIPYLAKASAANDYQIKVEDLLISIKSGNIILFDKRLKKEIIPRLGNAHNYSYNSLPVYHFLSDLQAQYFTKSYIGFNWGVLQNQFNFLPRVEFENIVLSSAKWFLTKIDLESLQNNKLSYERKQKLFFELKAKIGLPDLFLIVDGDNELLIDCRNTLAVDTFIESIKNRKTVNIEEYLFDNNHALVTDTEGSPYTNECIAIVLNETPINNSIIHFSNIDRQCKQIFTLGSEWLYYKIYCGVKTADHILTEKIKPITNELINKDIIDKWFFIRYTDPDAHIRFRLHLTNLENYAYVLRLINNELEPLIEQHQIHKIQADTYIREIDRYGDNSIHLAESLFFTDSVFVVNMLDMLDASKGGQIRWQIAIKSIDVFLNDFKLSLEEKYNLISKLDEMFFNEHGASKQLRLHLDDKFRKLRVKINEVLNPNLNREVEFYPIIELLQKRSNKNRVTVNEIFTLNVNNELQLKLNDLLASLLHMNLDRLFMGRNRTNEFVVYDLLARYYKSEIARIRKHTEKV